MPDTRVQVEGAGGEDHARRVQAFQGGGEFGDLAGLGVHLALGHGAALGDVVRGQEMDLAAVVADSAAGGLAVGGGLREQAGDGGLPRSRGGAALLALMPGRTGWRRRTRCRPERTRRRVHPRVPRDESPAGDVITVPLRKRRA